MYDPLDPPVIRDADIEQADLEAAGRDASCRIQRMIARYRAGDRAGAAVFCPHTWGYPTTSPAATTAHDPRAGQPGFRCLDCGSYLLDDPFASDGRPRVGEPCELTPEPLRVRA